VRTSLLGGAGAAVPAAYAMATQAGAGPAA
jgi:hypothetical protein